MEYLLDLGVDPKWTPTETSNDRASLYVAAASMGRTNVMTFLDEDDRFEVTPLDYQLALNIACRDDSVSTLDYILTHTDVTLDHPVRS